MERAANGRPFPFVRRTSTAAEALTCRHGGSTLPAGWLNSGAQLPNTRVMSIESTLEQVSAIRQALLDPAILIGRSSTALTGGTEAPAAGEASTSSGESSFATALARASGMAGVAPASSAEGPGARIVAIAETQIGQTEQPPGSNESPTIAEYRSATEGAIPGAPWCAYFASWVARQAGEPLGFQGQGLGAVSEIWSWAQSTGRAIPNGPGVVPKPGDLIVFGDEHVGIVRDVLPGGQIQTIEGNYENKVAANVRTPTEATGYVEMS
jgi:hypothetical protein